MLGNSAPQWIVRKSGTPVAAELTLPGGQGSALGIDTTTGAGYFLNGSDAVTALGGGSAVLGSAWTTLAFNSSTSTQLGFSSCNTATTTIAGVDNQRIEFEAYVYKTSGDAAVIGLTNGTDGFFISVQADGNIAYYRYKSGTATSFAGTGVDATRNFTGIFLVKLIVYNRPSTRQEVGARIDEFPVGVTGGSVFLDANVGINFSTTLTPFIRTNDLSKCSGRIRTFV